MIFNTFTDQKNQESKGFDRETFWMASKHLNQSTTESKVTDRIFEIYPNGPFAVDDLLFVICEQ